MRTDRRALLAFAALSIAGCDCGGTIDGDPCQTDRDCAATEMCVDSVCQQRPGADAGDRTDAAPVDAGPEGDGGTCATASDRVVAAPVDIIIAVDQSPSTADENVAISANLNSSLVQILETSGLDYRVILLSTDARLCPEAPLGDPSDCMASNPPRYYRIPHAINNSDALTALLYSYDGYRRRPNSCLRLEDPALRWRDHLRLDSQKVFLVFSDDDPETFSASGGQPACGGTTRAYCDPPPMSCPTRDCAGMDWAALCPNFNCPTFADRGADWPGGMDFASELYALEPAGMFGTASEPRWVFHSLVGLDRVREPTEPLSGLCDTCDFSGNTAEAAGLTYQRLSILTGGVRFPSCNTDYSPVFQRIASQIIPLACELVIEPTTAGGAINPSHTNVRFTPGDGSAPVDILFDSRPCDEADGWKWNDDFTAIVLCGAACDRVQADPDGEVDISVGCATNCRPGDEFCDE